MARINIEDSIYKDQRFVNLCIKMGSLDAALGCLVRAWSLAQKWYLTSEKKIPAEEWKKQSISDHLISVGLAELVDGKIWLKGADEQFAWLKQKSEAGKSGGLKSQANRASGRQATLNGREASLLSSLYSSLSTQNSLLKTHYSTTEELKPLRPPSRKREGAASKSGPVWDAYREQYAIRYGIDPVRNAKVNGQLAGLVGRLGAEEAPLVARFYVRSNLAFYVQRQHPVDFLLRDCETLRTQMLTGKQVTNMEARAAENRQQIVNSFGKFLTPEDEPNGNPK